MSSPLLRLALPVLSHGGIGRLRHRGTPLERFRRVRLLVLPVVQTGQLHSIHVLLLTRPRVRQQHDAHSAPPRPYRSVPLVHPEGTHRRLCGRDAARIGEEVGGRFRLAFLLGGGVIRVRVHGVLGRVLVVLFLFLFLEHVFVDLHGFPVLGLFAGLAGLGFRGSGERNCLDAYFLLLLFLHHLLGVRVDARFGVARDAKAFGHVKILIEPHGDGGRQRERKHVHHGIPVPLLHPQHEPHGGGHPAKPRRGAPQLYAHVPSAGVQYPRPEHRPHLGEGALVFIPHHSRDPFAEPPHRLVRVGLLHQNERGPHHGPLPDEIGHIRQHGLQHPHGRGIAGPRERNPHGDARRVAHVRMEALEEQPHELRHALGRPVEHQCESHHRGHADVVGDVAHGRVEETAHGPLRSGAHVRQGGTVHGPVPQDGVAVRRHGLEGGVGGRLPAVEGEGGGGGDPPDNLLVLGLPRVVLEFLEQFVAGGVAPRPPSHQDHADGRARRLAGHRRVRVEQFLELGGQRDVAGAHARQAGAQRRSVCDGFVGVAGAEVTPYEVAGGGAGGGAAARGG
mmetsp:Transcript_46799/g.91332  ORF Transcript_46799/g.91332 Transcript_46799/m.91332 type:complete len:563 (-) Transcript_46799:552-2240(-)